MKADTKILTTIQLKFLEILGKDEQISKTFYLTGGTALAGFYIPYRLSEDLDFFTEAEFDPELITVFLKKNKEKIGYKSYEFNTSFNRNLFFLGFPEESNTLKIEFTYFPFSPFEKQQTYKGMKIDSVYDIALNKVFSIYQNPTRSRDFIDLYMIQKKYGYKMGDLISKSASKFEWRVDPVKLGANFLCAEKLEERPRLLKNIKDTDWIEFFSCQADLLKGKIIE